jgi:hypothetical protein
MTNKIKGVVDTVVAVRTTTTTIKNDTKIIALDQTNAKELLEKFEANKADKATLEAQYKSLQAEIYALLGYKKVGDKWIGVADEGTIDGVSVVKVGTQTRTNFDKEKFLQENPELLPLVEAFTSESTNTVLKTTR